MAILILGGAHDEHAAHVASQLQTRGADVEFLQTHRFPGEISLTFDPIAGAGAVRLPSGRRLQFGDISSVYWRNFAGAGPPMLPDADQTYIAANDSRGLLESVLIHLPARWVNGWEAYRLHQTKPAALARVAAMGVRIPATLATNDSAATLDFAARHPHCIFKPVQGGAHTLPLTADHLTADALARLVHAPVTIQEEILGVDVRVFVAGEGVMACEILTDALDFRDDQQAAMQAIELPDDIAKAAVRIARELHLLWTGIDFRRTPEGEYVFFEANPSPMFLGFEARTGLPLTQSLLDLLWIE